jgi:hypothetical protein
MLKSPPNERAFKRIGHVAQYDLFDCFDEVRKERMHESWPASFRQLFCLGEHAGCEPETFFRSRWASAIRMFPCTNRDGRFYQSNHFSFMPEKQEMEYVPIRIRLQAQPSSCGLRLFLRRLFLRLPGRSHVCPVCQREWMKRMREKVIEF